MVLLMVTYACQNEFWDSSWEKDEKKAIESAKAWYERNKPESIGLHSSDGTEQVLMKAEWSNAFATQYEDLEVVETNLMSQGRLLYIDKSCMEKYEATGSELDVYMLNGPRAMLNTSQAYSSYNYDYGRTGLNNFKNLSTLSNNC